MRVPMMTILFVCSGNTCRSPMAEAVARDWLATHRPELASEVFVASAGVLAMDGMPTTPETLEALRRAGIDFEGRSTLLNPDMVDGAAVIFCMTAAHRDAVTAMLGDASTTRIELLDPAGDVTDPIGAGQSVYNELLDHFRKLIPERLDEVLPQTSRTGGDP